MSGSCQSKRTLRVLLLNAFIFIQLTLASESTDINCEIKQNKNCLRCVSGFVLAFDGMSCLASSDRLLNCLQIGFFGECILCECGYSAFDKSGECVTTPPDLHGCQAFDENMNCLKPKAQFQLLIQSDSLATSYSNQIQFTNGSNCEINRKGKQCLRCHSGFMLVEGNTCTQANHKIVNNYYSYFDGKTLKSKDIRFVAIENIGVFPHIENCLFQAITDQNHLSSYCQACMNGRIPNESRTKCFKIPFDLCGEVSDFDSQICSKCEDNERYFLLYNFDFDRFKCVPRSHPKYDGCDIYSHNSNTCSLCQPGFYLTEYGACNSLKNSINALQTPIIVENCELYVREGKCLECKIGFILTTIGSCMVENDQNCILIGMDELCVKCVVGMIPVPKTNKCSDSNISCLVYGYETQKCVLCVTGYWLDESGDCNLIQECQTSNGIDQVCLLCQNKHYLVPVLNSSLRKEVICQEITDFDQCFSSDGKTNQCHVCARHFKYNFELGTCEPNVSHNGETCDVYGYYISSASPNEKGVCLKHSQAVDNISCFLLDPKNDRCLRCKNSFYPDEYTGECLQINFCYFSDGISKKCLQSSCDNMYIDENGVSKAMGKNCITNKRDPICIQVDDVEVTNSPKQIIKDRADNYGEFKVIAGVSVDKNCYIFEKSETNSYQCIQCHNLFFLNQEGSCEATEIHECGMSDGKNNRCLLCNNNLTVQEYLDSAGNLLNRCVGGIDGKVSRCKVMKYEYCESCENLFYPIQMGQVCASIENPFCESSLGSSYWCLCQLYNFKGGCSYNQYCSELNTLTRQCKECIPGFKLINLNKNIIECQRIEIGFCAELSTNGKCLKCIDGFYLNPRDSLNQICIKITDRYCKRMIDYSDKCAECENGFFLSKKGSCKAIENCSQFDSKCISCFPPFVVNAIYQCEKVAHCIQSNGKQCLQCESRYYLSDSKKECIRLANCIESNGIDRNCTVCEPFFKRISFTCVPNQLIRNCIEYQAQSQCQKCRNLYALHNGSKQCLQIANLSNCRKSDGVINLCLECEPTGFILDDNARCVKISNCQISNGIDACLFCSRLFFLDIATNYCKPRIVIENCEFYNPTKDACNVCRSLYYLSENNMACIEIQGTLRSHFGCFMSNGVSNECMICTQTLSKTQITKTEVIKLPLPRTSHFENIIDDCALRRVMNFLQTCAQTFYMQSDLCIPRSVDADHCLVYFSDKDSCRICQNGFQINHSEELPYLSYCEPIAAAQQVHACAEYSPNTNTCIRCEEKNNWLYILNPNTNECVDIFEECFDSTDSVACVQRYMLYCEEIIDSKCVSCKNRFYLEDGECRLHEYQAECVIYHKEQKNSCFECKKGFSVVEGRCEEADDINCQKWQKSNNLNECVECKFGFAFINEGQTCEISDIVNCNRINVDLLERAKIAECSSCKENFEINSYGECQKPRGRNKNCLEYNQHTNQCLKCDQNHSIWNEDFDCIELNHVCAIPLCGVYSLESKPDKYICEKCSKQGYVIDRVLGTCVLEEIRLADDKGDSEENNNKNDQTTEQKKNNKHGQNGEQNYQETTTFSEGGVIVIILIGLGLVGFGYVLLAWMKLRKKSHSVIPDDQIQLANFTTTTTITITSELDS